MRGPPRWFRDSLSYLLVALIIISATAIVLGCAMVNAELVYDDWSCAFAHCVKVKR